MKIAIITSTFPPYKGGMGNAAFYIAEELNKKGHNITVFTPNYGGKNNPLDKGGGGVVFEVKRLIPWLKYGNAAWLPQLFWRLWHFDKIYLIYPFFGGAEAVWILKKIKGKKVKLIINYQMDVTLSGLPGIVAKLHAKFILPRIVTAADLVSVLSFDHGRHSFLKNLMARDEKKFIETPNGVNAEKFKILSAEEKNKFRQELGISADEKVLMFCGGLDKAHYFKGVPNLLQAFKKINPEKIKTKLIIVGDGDLKNDFIKLSAELEISKQVIFPGEFGHNELLNFYNICDVFVLPSTGSESFGIVLTEAMICGKPVIASALPGVRVTFSDQEHGFLVEPGSVNDLAEKLEKILKLSNEERERMGKRAREMVLKKYTWERIARIVETEFKKQYEL
jgi:glycosyltransferase involved in cell wall biosynthesis